MWCGRATWLLEKLACNSPTVRKHGCEWPWNPAQVLAVFAYFGFVAGFWFLLSRTIEADWFRRTLLVVYLAAALCVAITFLITILVDPADPAVRGGDAGSEFCRRCKVRVQPSSKHCRFCNKCCEGFDHHCPWLNNCIAKRNYVPFFILLVTVTTKLLIQIAVGSYAFVHSFTHPDDATAFATELHLSLNLLAYKALVGLQIGLAIFLLHPVGTLLALHMVLRIRGITTYEFIVLQRQLIELKEMRETMLFNTEPDEIDSPHLPWWRKYKHRKIFPGPGGSNTARLDLKRKVGLSPWSAWNIHRYVSEERELQASVTSQTLTPKSERLSSGNQLADSLTTDQEHFAIQAGQVESGTEDGAAGSESKSRPAFEKMVEPLLNHGEPEKNPSVRLPPLSADVIMDVSRESSIAHSNR